MKNVRNYFKNITSEVFDIREYEGHLEAKTDTVLFMVVEPHEGTKERWMLRVSPMASFDRWANSTAIEEFFDTEAELCNYLNENQLRIYKSLLDYLSNDYEEIYEQTT